MVGGPARLEVVCSAALDRFILWGPMSGRPIATRYGAVGVWHWLTAVFLQGPTCVICGRGHPSTGWLVDPLGRISGRCPGCLKDPQAQHRQPQSSSISTESAVT